MPKPVLQTTRIKTSCWLLVVSCVVVSVSISSVRQLCIDLASTPLPAPSFLFIRFAWAANALLFTAAVLLHLNPSTWRGSFTQSLQVDWNLVLFLWTPPSVLLARMNQLDPGPHISWTWHFSFFLVAAAAMDLPPAHSLVQLLAMLPFLIMLELFDTCNLSKAVAALATTPTHETSTSCAPPSPFGAAPTPSDPWTPSPPPGPSTVHGLLSQCSSEGQLSTYLLTQLPWSVLCLAAAVVIPVVTYTAHRDRAVLHGHGAACDAKAPGPRSPGAEQPMEAKLPLESLGLALSPLRLRQLLLAPVRWLERLAEMTGGRLLLIRLICIPLGCYYGALAVLSRHGDWNMREISGDEWLVVMAVFFMLGRESCKLDMMPFFAQSESHLRAAKAVLSDLLPGHIVNLLIQQQGGGADHPGGHADAPDPKPQAPEPGANLRCRVSTEVTTPRSRVSSEVRERAETPFCSAAGLLGERATPASSPTVSSALMKLSPVMTSEHQEQESFFRVLSASLFPPAQQPSAASAGSSSRDASNPLSALLRRSVYGAPPLHPAAPPAALKKQYSDQLLAEDVFSEEGLLVQTSGLLSPALKLAEAHDCLTIFFSDIIGFATWAHKLSPEKVMNTLNDLYTRLDDIIINEMPNLYKVETIGDAYMVAGNLLAPDPAHAAHMVRFALRAQQEAAKVLRPDMEDGTTLQLRIGLHSGPAMSGIVGKLRRRFCIFGDTVNMASRTETACPPGCVQVTAATYSLALPLSGRDITFHDQGEAQLKGSDRPIRMYLAELGHGA